MDQDTNKKIATKGNAEGKKTERRALGDEEEQIKEKGITYYQICFSWNMLVRLLRQLLRDQRAHCFKNRGLSSSVVSTSASGWYCI